MEINPVAHNLVDRGNQFYSRNQYEQAIEAYREAISLAPDSPYYQPFKFVIGDMLFALQRYQEAAQTYREVVEYSPGHEQAWAGLGKSWMMVGEDRDAVYAFERCLEIDAGAVEAWYYGAIIYSLLGEPEHARQYLQEAIRLRPEWRDAAAEDELLRGYL